MSDEHDPIEGRIDDGFDRLHSDSQSLDAMAPLRALHDRRARLPWGRIALGGGLVAAALVVVAIVAFGGDDDRPEEIFAGPGGDDERTATVTIDDEALAVLTVNDLVGTTWILVEGVAPAGRITVVPGFEPTFEIGAEGFSGNLSCNDYGFSGSLAPVSDRTAEIDVGTGFSKLAGCLTEGVMESEERFNAALNDVTLVELQDGFLVVTGPSTELIFIPAPPEPDAPAVPRTSTVADLDDRVPGPLPDSLAGTDWVLISGGSELPLPAAWRRHRLQFDGDRFVVTGMCSWYGGEIAGDGAPFAGGDLSPIASECPTELDALDRAFVNALSSATGGRLEEGRLHLAAAAGDLIFQRDVLDDAAFTDVRWELTGWDLGVDGSARPVEAPAYLELGRTELVDGRAVGSVSGNSGCIAFGGEWQEVDRTILLTIEVTDADSCPDPSPDQDLQVLEAIASGTVPLFLPGGVMHLHSVREPSAVAFELAAGDAGDPRLDGTTWQLVADSSLPVDPAGFTISFTGNTISGNAPCNGFGGRYSTDEERLVFRELSQTLRGCSRSGEEELFIDALLTTGSYGIDNGQLVIETAAGVLVFEPA